MPAGHIRERLQNLSI